jgi:sulfite dehydrogenase
MKIRLGTGALQRPPAIRRRRASSLAACLLGLAVVVGMPAAFADEAAELALGKQLFTQAEPQCAVCHTLKDAGAQGEIGPSLDDLQPDAEQVANALRTGVGIMPSYKDKLTPEQIMAIAHYVAHATGLNRPAASSPR